MSQQIPKRVPYGSRIFSCEPVPGTGDTFFRLMDNGDSVLLVLTDSTGSIRESGYVMEILGGCIRFHSGVNGRDLLQVVAGDHIPVILGFNDDQEKLPFLVRERPAMDDEETEDMGLTTIDDVDAGFGDGPDEPPPPIRFTETLRSVPFGEAPLGGWWGEGPRERVTLSDNESEGEE